MTISGFRDLRYYAVIRGSDNTCLQAYLLIVLKELDPMVEMISVDIEVQPGIMPITVHAIHSLATEHWMDRTTLYFTTTALGQEPALCKFWFLFVFFCCVLFVLNKVMIMTILATLSHCSLTQRDAQHERR